MDTYPLDETDQAILAELQANGRISNADLARLVGLSPPAVYARLKRLEQSSLIRGYAALLDREAAGYDMLCLINISMQSHQRSAMKILRDIVVEMPEVLECYHVTGEYDYQLKVVVHNRKALEHFVIDRLSTISGIAHIRTILVLSEIKSTTALPLV